MAEMTQIKEESYQLKRAKGKLERLKKRICSGRRTVERTLQDYQWTANERQEKRC